MLFLDPGGKHAPHEWGHGSLKGYATASGPLPADCGRRVARIAHP